MALWISCFFFSFQCIILNVCVVVLFLFYSGESGAGKTESTKLLLRHIMELCRANSQLEQQILQVEYCIKMKNNQAAM